MAMVSTGSISSNSTSNNSYKSTMVRLTASHCIPWLVVLITECLAIVILNMITIIVFTKQRQLKHRSTFFIIHLAIVDILTGGVSGPLNLKSQTELYCDLSGYNQSSNTWLNLLKIVCHSLFPMASLINLAVISLERLNATFRPFSHRLIKKWFYGVMVVFIWLTSLTMHTANVMFYQTTMLNSDFLILFFNPMYISFYLIFLVTICLSYISIFIKVRCSPQPRHHGAENRERKLTQTLFIVTLVSLLSWMPFIVVGFHYKYFSNFSLQSYFHIRFTLTILALANSLVNPIIYSMRMPRFRAGVAVLFCKAPNRPNAADLHLRNI